jgi:hypothetical protein
VQAWRWRRYVPPKCRLTPHPRRLLSSFAWFYSISATVPSSEVLSGFIITEANISWKNRIVQLFCDTHEPLKRTLAFPLRSGFTSVYQNICYNR